MTRTIVDLSVEVLARIFEELSVEDVWAARGVSRFWCSVFGFVAYGTAQSIFLRGSRISVEVVCQKTSPKDECLDQHVICGDLTFEGGLDHLACWEAPTEVYEFWPGGDWRKYSLQDVLSDVRLRISKLSSTQDLPIRIGDETVMRSCTTGPGSLTHSLETSVSLYKDFVLSIEAHEDTSCAARPHTKHRVVSFVAPKWQVYALLARCGRIHRQWIETVNRHYVLTTSYLRPSTSKLIPAESAFYSD
jgi:hypothetical protein